MNNPERVIKVNASFFYWFLLTRSQAFLPVTSYVSWVYEVKKNARREEDQRVASG